MEDFFDKIKKKLSVDNIFDLMKDGKLKDELKQTLTATVNLNEKPKQEESRPIVDPLILEPNKHVTIENIQHNTAQGQTKANRNEISQSDEKPLKEVEKQIVLEIHQQNVTEEQELTLENPKEQPQDKVESIETKIILHEVPRTGEETLKEAQKPLLVEKLGENLADEQSNVIKDESKHQPEDRPKSIKSNLNVLQKTAVTQPEPENTETLNNFEMFIG